MKNTIRIILSGFFVSLLSGCDGLLDIEAENSLSGDIYTSDQNFQDALSGAYINLGGIYDGIDGGELYGGDFQLMGTLLARQKNTTFFWRASEAPNYQDFMDKDILDINLRVEANWRRAYETLNIVNGILQNLDKVSSASLRDQIEGQALAIRGILYFELVRFWAPQFSESTINAPAVPILLNPVSDVSELPILTRATVSEVYGRAEQDLENARDLLEQQPGLIDNRVCSAFLTRIAMQKNDFAGALLEMDGLLNNYALTNQVMDAFNNTEVTTEDVFVILQNSVSTSGTAGTRTGLVAHTASLSGVGFAALNVNFELLTLKNDFTNTPGLSPGDDRIRLQDNLTTNSTINNVNANAAYYNDVINTTQVSPAKFLRTDANIPVIRFSELLLYRAEATLEEGGFSSPVTGSALDDLNTVRLRAGIPALADTLTADQFYDSLVYERSREFLFEGIFFHDLKRWAANPRIGSRNFSIGGQSPLAEDFILPIPQAECDASPGLCN
ncbi:MAG: RagB/SusD family nutrient uptake outer membrane protein [Bacteroidota bacterium]